jgi:UPF0271 protein
MDLDLNCDLGEGCDFDAELMPLITSANIACGFHAGDATTAHAALRLAAKHGVQAGAHPGYGDRANFGRTELKRTEDQIFEECVYQVGALAGLALAENVTLRYLKPHGALYNQACREDAYARPVVVAAGVFGLAVMGLPGSRLEAAASGRCEFIAEGFADRRYRLDGSLVPRTEPDAFVTDPDEAVRQAERLIRSQGIRTLCVHGDNPHALDFVRRLRSALTRQKVNLHRF